jgi:hypothetical protein
VIIGNATPLIAFFGGDEKARVYFSQRFIDAVLRQIGE